MKVPMALSAQLHVQPSQQLKMTPQLMQSIKLLSLTHNELEHFIAQEVERNPLLEFADDNYKKNVSAPKNKPIDKDKPYIKNSRLENTEIFGNKPRDKSINFGFNSHKNNDIADFSQFISEPPSLHTHINEQIIFSFHNKIERFIAIDLSNQLDETGYFIGDTQETATRLRQPLPKIEYILQRLQCFDPIGVFAKNLQQCLTLQLKAKNRFDPVMAKLLMHLQDLAKHDFSKLKRICAVDEDDLLDMLAEIRALDPKPGLVFHKSPVAIIIPDAFVHHNDKNLQVTLNHDLLPTLLMNKTYSRIVSHDKKDQDFLNNALQKANWLLKALNQRADTLLLVVDEIVRQQQGFFYHGISALKPLNMAMIAKNLELHESTISRIISHKYISTPYGTFNLRFFFPSAIGAIKGHENHSAQFVRQRIKYLIDNEAINAILSDDTIVKLLQKENINIARRTVTKYREAMNIYSSIIRRREKKALLLSTRI